MRRSQRSGHSQAVGLVCAIGLAFVVCHLQAASPIIEKCSQADGFGVGAPIGAFTARLRGPAPQEQFSVPHGPRYLADEGSVIEINQSGIVQTLTISRPGLFTQRLVVIGESRLSDVLQRYGSPNRSWQDGPWLIVDYAYDGIGFEFLNPARIAPTAFSVSALVARITLHTRVGDLGQLSAECRASIGGVQPGGTRNQ
jgi:hypothetical protein